MKRFIVDAQLPPALARWLAGNGHRAEHVSDLDMQSAPYTVIWSFALQAGACIITKDEDFAQRRMLTGEGPSIIWLRLPNTRRRELLKIFETIFPDALAALDRGESLIELT